VIHLLISLCVLLLAATVGLWYLNTCMNISPRRMGAANWVFLFSTLTFVVNVISVPYNATIVAHERMSAFAYISVYEALARLAVASALTLVPLDRLVAYGALLMLMQVSVRLLYGAYCKRHFSECGRLTLRVDKALLGQMFSFASWTVVGSLSFIFHTQGIALIINIFFGAAVNAAQGIANQVNSVVNQFVSNFLLAMNPQVVKSYAVGELGQMHQLVFRGCRFAFFLVSFFVIPLTLEAPALLGLWLKTVPAYTVIFVRLVLLISLVNCYSGILATSQGATGKVKAYQLTLTLTGFLHLPLTWVFYSLGFEPYYAMYVYLVIVVVLQATRIAFVSRSTHFPMARFYRQVVLLCLLVFLASAAVPALLHLLLAPCLLSTVTVCLSSVLTTGLSSLYIGMTRGERTKVLSNISKRLRGR
ncbi:MAG: holin, partial [Prevotellaceae bacterium]|nr:holin [Prevotellaceae bacterium]